MSPDPDNAGADLLAPQSWNVYSYVLNNPLNATDPTGLDCVYTAGAEGNPNAGSLTIVRGDCINKGGKDDGGVFVDNDANHPVQNSDVTMSENGSVGLVSYTNANGVTTGYACVGNCPADSVQVTARPDAPTMSAAPMGWGISDWGKRNPLFVKVENMLGAAAGEDPEICGPMTNSEANAQGYEHKPSEQTPQQEKLNQAETVKDSSPKRPGPSPKYNPHGNLRAEAAAEFGNAPAYAANAGACLANAK